MTYQSDRPKSYGATEREIDHTADQAQDAFDNARDTAKQTVSDIKDRAQQTGDQVRERADAATTTVGEKMTDVAQTIRERAPDSGPVADIADTTARTLNRAGTYLQQQNLDDMRTDLEGIIRRHPIEALLIGLGVGYLLARSTRR